MANSKYNFLPNFPLLDTPRPQQEEAFKKIDNIFSSGKKYAIVNLPTGSGKSHIGVSMARASSSIDDERRHIVENYGIYKKDKNGSHIHEDLFLNNHPFGAFILTVTKSLQDQYQSLFPELITVKGKSNYMCAVDNNLTVNFAPCLFSPKLKQECFDKNRCPYYKIRNEALIKQDSILNYKAFFNLPEFLRKREFYICDEASEIEDELISQYTVNISYAFLQSENIDFKKLISDDSEKAKHWLQDIFIQLKNEWLDLKYKTSLMSNKKNTPSGLFFKQMQRLGRYTELINTLTIVLERWDECEYLVEKKDREQVVFVPYDIKPAAQYIFNGASKILMMSATISNAEEFAKSLGIKKDEYEFVEIPSTFDSKKSPIYCSTQYNLSYKNLERDLPKIAKLAVDICDKHKGEKGIIHTHTNQITEALKKKTKNNPRFLFREVGLTNENIIEEHRERKSEDTILVSPSLDTGISLDGDLGRFQIILKAPYLPLGSKRIKKMFECNPKHYIMKMLNTLIQMSGRCTRSIEDHSTTYILDGTAVKAILTNKHHLPKHFLDRFM